MATAGSGFGNIRDLLVSFGGLVSYAIPLAAGLALLGFFWGLAKYIFSQGNEEQKVEGKKVMVWGLVALFVMASVFGIIQFFQQDLNVQGGSGIIQFQQVGPGSGGGSNGGGNPFNGGTNI